MSNFSFTQEEKVQLLGDLVGIQSINGDELIVANYSKELLAKYKIEAEIINLSNNRLS